MPKRNPENGSEYVIVQAAIYDTDDHIIGRQERLLDKISPSDMIHLTNLLTDLRRKKIEENATKTGLSSDLYNQQLNEFDARPIDRGDITQWGILPVGVVEVLKRSLKRDHPNFTEDQLVIEVDKLALSSEEMVRTSAGCMHIILKPKAKEGEGAPNPPVSGDPKVQVQAGTPDVSPTETGSESPSA